MGADEETDRLIARIREINPAKDQGLSTRLHDLAGTYQRRPQDGWQAPPDWDCWKEGRQLFVGDDPGKEGWISWIDHEGNPVGQAPRPSIGVGKGDTFDAPGYVALVKRVRADGRIVRWTIESQVVSGILNKRSTIAVQFEAYGKAQGILIAMDVPVERVTSGDVRDAMGVPSSKGYKGKGAAARSKRKKDMTAEEEKAHAKEVRKVQAKARGDALLNLIRIAQARWPSWSLLPTEKSTAPSADMASSRLIAEHGRRTHLGMTMPKAGETA